MIAVEAMARAMCRVAGDNPDLMVYPPMQHAHLMSNSAAIVVPYHAPMPAWQLFERHAQAALEALKDVPPPVFEPFDKRKENNIGVMYQNDRQRWITFVDALLGERA